MPKTNAQEAVFLGFDFGTKRLGVAVGQRVTCTATPLPVLDMKQGVPNWAELDTVVQQWKPSAFIVGIPYNMDGTEGAVTQPAKQFAQALATRFNRPAYPADERLTTVEARQQRFDEGGYRALKAGPVDSAAARLILEAWLREQG